MSWILLFLAALAQAPPAPLDAIYGKTPAGHTETRATQPLIDAKALKGKAVRKQVTIFFTDRNDGPRMNLLLYLPPGAGKVPVFLGLNANGNQSVSADPGIEMNEVWSVDPIDPKKLHHLQADDRSRGINAAQWPIEAILAHGFGFATVYCHDIAPDFPGRLSEGVPSLFPDGDHWTAIGAWAWGLSRAAEYLRNDGRIDPLHIGLIGQGPQGVAALWAAAQDRRFAFVISNDAGKGGKVLLNTIAPKRLLFTPDLNWDQAFEFATGK